MPLARTCMTLLAISGLAGNLAAGMDASQGGIPALIVTACFTTILACHVALYAVTDPAVAS